MVDVVFNVSSPNFETTIYTIWSEICVEFFQNNENKEQQNSQQLKKQSRWYARCILLSFFVLFWSILRRPWLCFAGLGSQHLYQLCLNQKYECAGKYIIIQDDFLENICSSENVFTLLPLHLGILSQRNSRNSQLNPFVPHDLQVSHSDFILLCE